MAKGPPKNKKPVAVTDNVAALEDVVSIDGNVLANDKDPNAGDTLRVTTVGTFVGTYGTLDLFADGSYTYTLSPGAQSLSAGELFVEQFSYTVSDQGNLTASGQLKISLTGVNDAPTIAAIAPTELAEPSDDQPLTATIDVTFTDVDLTDVGHTATITGVTASGTMDGLSLTEEELQALISVGTVSKDSGSTSGSLNLSFSAAATAFAYLNNGEELTLTYTVQVDDGDGGITEQEFIIRVTGYSEQLGPVITSDGGGNTATLSIAEGEGPLVTTVTATGSAPITYSIVGTSEGGGADADFFQIGLTSGALSFIRLPDFEAPMDVGGDNVFDVTVRAANGSYSDTQDIAITLIDVDNVYTDRYFASVGDPSSINAIPVEVTPSGTFTNISSSQNLIAAMSQTAVTNILSTTFLVYGPIYDERAQDPVDYGVIQLTDAEVQTIINLMP